MTGERWARVKALFQAAVEQPVENRGAFLAAATGDDSDLRREVESLLTADTSDVRFFNRLPIANRSIGTDPDGAGVSAGSVFETVKAIAEEESPSMIGRQLGSCRVQSLLGAGGMGEERQSPVVRRWSSVPTDDSGLVTDDWRLTTPSPCRRQERTAS